MNRPSASIEAVPDSSAKKLRIMTAYMQKANGNISQELNMSKNDPQQTPEAPLGFDGSVANPIISDSGENGNTKFSLKEDSRKRMEAAKAFFGTTKSFAEAGYVLSDGGLLDFSG